MRVHDHLDLPEQAAPPTPAAGRAIIYPKADGRYYEKDSAGVERLLSANPDPLPRLVDAGNLIDNPWAIYGLDRWKELNGTTNNTFTRVVDGAGTYGPTGFLPMFDQHGLLSGGSKFVLEDKVAISGHRVHERAYRVDTTKDYVLTVGLRNAAGTTSETYVKLECYNDGGSVVGNVFAINGASVPIDGTWTEYTLQVGPGVTTQWPAGTTLAVPVVWGNELKVGKIEVTRPALARRDRLVTTTLGSPSANPMGAHEVHVDKRATPNVWTIQHYANSITKLGIDGVRISELSPVGLDYPHDLDDDGTHLWVVAQNSNRLYKVALADNTLVASYAIPTPSTATYGVYCWNGAVWCGSGNGASSRLHKFNPGTETFTTYDIGQLATSNNVSIVDDGTSLWVGSQVQKAVLKVNPTTGAVAQTVALGFEPYGIGYADGYVYAGGSTDLVPADPSIVSEQRMEVCRIRTSDGVKTDTVLLRQGVESNWKWDGRDHVYATAALPRADPASNVIVRWSIRTNVVDVVETGLTRLKAVEPVGDQLWGASYYAPWMTRFASNGGGPSARASDVARKLARSTAAADLAVATLEHKNRYNVHRDSFDRANGAPGTLDFPKSRSWQLTGTWAIASNRLTCTTQNSYATALVDAYSSTGRLKATIAVAGGHEWWLVFNYADASNHYRVGTQFGVGNAYQIQNIVAGAVGTFDTLLNPNAAPNAASGDVIEIYRSGNDGIDVIINGVLIWTAGETDRLAVRSLGFAAFRSAALPNVAFDDFEYAPY